MKTFIAKGVKNITFKNRIIFLFLISSLTPFICLGLFSFYTIESIIGNKVESAFKSSLKQDRLVLENLLNNLNHVAQQLAFNGGTNKLIEELHTTEGAFEQVMLRDQIYDELAVTSFTNPNIGLFLYYDADTGVFDFESTQVQENFSIEGLPVLVNKSEIVIYGPHKSFNRNIEQFVFSTLRKVNLPNRNYYLYMETSQNAVPTLFGSRDPRSDSSQLLIVDPNGKIIFSPGGDPFPEDRLFPEFHPEAASGTYQDYFWSKETSDQGWSIVSILPTPELNRERNQWLVQITGFFMLFILIVLLIAWLLWKMVYRPLEKFNSEIKSLIQHDMKEQTDLTFIPEFDFLLHQIRNMKVKIWELYGQIEQKEKGRADLEVEMLLYQINPHFLMNTLDTVHWLAVMSGQKEIDKLVLALNKLLNYNLGKMGEASTIADEVQALKQYLQLQQIRYDFKFDVDIQVSENVMLMPIPRFILQPLVENALYHGVSDDGYIHVNIQYNDALEIIVQDNGAGMSEEKINYILFGDSQEKPKAGMGIGIRYVKRVLEAQYGDDAKFEIKSEIGKGTVVHLSIPVQGGG